MKVFIFIIALFVFVFCGSQFLWYRPWEWVPVLVNSTNLNVVWYELGQPVAAVLYALGALLGLVGMIVTVLAPGD